MDHTGKLGRRGFLGLAAAGALAASLPEGLPASPFQNPVVNTVVQNGKPVIHEAVPWQVLPFPNPQVRLLDGIFKQEMELNQRYLLTLPNDRLAHMFRITAKLTSTAQPFGGWENPTCELRGHFTGGHYLSAAALLYASTGDEEIKKKGDELVAILAQCQQAHGNGYLSAFPEEFFDRLREGKPVWAPFYTIHKIMAGHLDLYTHCGNEQALNTLEKMAGWVGQWVGPLSDDHMQRVLEVEQGGMLEVLCNLYAVTGKEEYLFIARRFDHKAVFDPLSEYRDELRGLHANTNIPKMIGAARQYEVTGIRRYHDIASYFWHEVTSKRTFCSGGTSYDEHWLAEPGKLGHEVGQTMEECCCGYNMLKLTRHIFGWTANPRAMDYYERTLFNSRLGTQNEQGLKGYFYPLGQGWWKYYNTPMNSFWCCTGTGAEEFSKFNDTIYFHNGRDLYVNLFIASELSWPEKGLRLRQTTGFPEQDGTSLLLHVRAPIRMAVNIRVPYWATQGGTVRLNGQALPVFASPSSYLTVERVWNDGDRIDVTMPMSLHAAPVPGDETQQAMMYGPLVLAGELGSQGLNSSLTYSGYDTVPQGTPASTPEIEGSEDGSSGWVERVSTSPLAFQTVSQSQTISLTPLYREAGQRYVVYWKMKRAKSRLQD